MRLIAKKPCSFGGRTFYIGEEIPTEFVLNPKAQEKLGVIAIVACGGEVGMKQEDMVAQVGEVEFGVPIRQKNGNMTLYLSEEQICSAVEIMQMSPAEAKEAIKGIASENILILLNACDSRKAIKEATEAAASGLTDEEGADESEGDE